ncbi:MAG: M48 family metallopeptidase [Firmicutes bacterium]|nr:M48 family metallopeptidase [Alicyclobacillaceae bacterium]MCL6496900.1 M48 family metallopeptidase [Bacillota bacterium]
MPTVQLPDGSWIPYTVEVRPRRKSFAMVVNAQGQVAILVPPGGVDPALLEGWIRHKASWLLDRLAQSRASRRRFETGEEFFHLGVPKPLTVTIAPECSPGVCTTDEGLAVVVPHPDAVREALVQFYQAEAKRWIPERVAAFSPSLAMAAPPVRLRDYRSRWGACRSGHWVAFHWRLMQAPPAVVDYVVVHELCHWRYPHHRPTFWRAVGRLVPDYAHHHQWLRKHAGDLFW